MVGRKKNIICLLLLTIGFAITAVFLNMASTLSPWSTKLPHLDSAVWLRCAVEMKQGKIIYRDIWDHKGPMLFAIQFLGLTLTPHSLNGIWLLECVFSFLTLWSFYLTAKLITENKLVGFLVSVLSMHPVYYFYQEGNCVEEWALPFIGFSLYFFAKYMKTGKLIKSDIILVGVLMGCSFLLNGNLVAVWICYILIISIDFIRRRKFQEFGKCVLFFGTGFFSILAIVLLVLIFQGALSSFLNIYFGFNYDYVSGVSFIEFKNSVLNFAFKDNWFVFSHMIFLFLLLHDWKLDWKWSAFFYTIISLIFISISGRSYIHYGLQLVPCMVIPMAACIDRIWKWCNNYKEFLLITVVAGFVWVRFDVQDYKELIHWAVSTEGDNYYAGGDLENYTIVNKWIDNRWNKEALEKWVVNDM